MASLSPAIRWPSGLADGPFGHRGYPGKRGPRLGCRMHAVTVVDSVFARVSGEHEVTATQARVLCILVEQPRGMAELAGPVHDQVCAELDALTADLAPADRERFRRAIALVVGDGFPAPPLDVRATPAASWPGPGDRPELS